MFSFLLFLLTLLASSPAKTPRRNTRQHDRIGQLSQDNQYGNGQLLMEDEHLGGIENFCNEKLNINCDTKALLSCQRSRCTCFHPDEMIYDGIKGQCVAKAGGRCVFGKDEPYTELRHVQNVDCVLHGFCDTGSGRCLCSPQFYNSLNVSCIPQKTFDQACHFDFECREDYNLHCVAGLCLCDPKVSIKHRKYEVCLGLAGEKAIEGNCIEFSDPINFNPLIPVRCQCKEGYVRGLDKRCHGSLRQACTVESPCQRGLTCVQGTCLCPFNDFQIYHPTKGICLSEVYGPCKTSANCVSTAFCNTTGPYNECQCKPGYIAGSSRRCEKSVGTPCHISPKISLASGSDYVEECSSSALLQCRDGRCSCPELKTFSIEQGKCVGLIGSICLKTDEYPMCTQNAQCEFKKRLGFSMCSCNSQSIVTPDRKCHLLEIETTTTEAPKPTEPPEGSGFNELVNEEDANVDTAVDQL